MHLNSLLGFWRGRGKLHGARLPQLHTYYRVNNLPIDIAITLTDERSRTLFLAESTNALLNITQTGLRVHKTCYLMGIGSSFPVDKTARA
jgi:hypothetical protein